MSKRMRRCLPQYSLRTFLLATCIGGVTVAWLALRYAEYRIEQQLVLDLTTRTPSFTQVVNGQSQYHRMTFM